MRPPFLFASLPSAYCGTCIAGEERRSNEPKLVVRPPDGYGVIFLWLSKAIWDEMETKVVLRVFFGADGRIVAKEVYLCRVSPR